MQNINEIDDLIKLISKLPGLGPKSAKRIVLKLINNKDEIVKPLANTLALLKIQIYFRDISIFWVAQYLHQAKEKKIY